MSIPLYVSEYLKAQGYRSKNPMQSRIELWEGWYSAQNNFYQYTARRGKRTYKIERISCRPGRMACLEWAGLIFSEEVVASAKSESATKRLGEVLSNDVFQQRVTGGIERAWGLGTSVLAWRVKDYAIGQLSDPTAELMLQRYTADNVVAISYDENGCSELAAVGKTTVSGETYTQLLLYVLEGGTYHIKVVLFNEEGERASAEGIIDDFDTLSAIPPFGLIKPAIENTYEPYSPYGVSVFDDAVGSMQTIDTFFDNLNRDVKTGQMMVFMDESLLEQDKDGNVIVPREKDQQYFTLRSDKAVSSSQPIVKEWAPNLRVEQNTKGLSTALQMFGIHTGFGPNYWTFEKESGLKTATEVISTNSKLYRTMRKHENAFKPVLKNLLGSMLEIESARMGRDYGDIGAIEIKFDDSIIQDTDTERKRDREDVAMGALPLWEYRKKWYGETEEQAKTTIEQIKESDIMKMSGPAK